MFTQLAAGIVVLMLSSTIMAESYDDRWYAVPSLSYIIPDDKRDAEEGFGFSFGFGKPVAKNWNVELHGIYDSLDLKTSNDNYLQMGAFLDGLYIVNREANFSPYAVLGLGMIDSQLAKNNDINPAAHAGAGFMYQVTDHGIAIRSDVRYRMDFDDRNAAVDSFGDWVVNIGLSLPFGNRAAMATAASAALIPVAMAPPMINSKVADADNDGIPDDSDNCSNTPAGAKTDAAGCESDSDGDLIADSQDQCDSTPDNVTVDNSGCPLDNDNDGIADYQDQCSNTLSSTIVNAMGCEPDADNDGITDLRDMCQNSIGTKNIDSDGCSLNEVINTKAYNFEFNSTELNDSSKSVLADIATRLKAHPNEQVEIIGHTDNLGSEKFNSKLSEQRAASVKQFLVEQGINESQLITKGLGAIKPVADNQTDQGRAKNRRVEMFVMD